MALGALGRSCFRECGILFGNLYSPNRQHRGDGTSNLILANGDHSFEALIADIEQGFLVTELMGSSVSLITGDYSRGAGGFWIENGQITWPVSEATIAGNLKDMFKAMVPADDADTTSSTIVPSLRIDAMMVAGS